MKGDETDSVKGRGALARERVRARLPQKINLVRSGVVLGTPEIVGLSASVVLLALAIVSYFYLLSPARARLEKIESEIAKQEKLLQDSGQGLQANSTGQATVSEIVASLRQFEADHLATRTEGQQAVLETLHDAIRRHNLRDKGQSFTVIEPRGADDRASSSRGARAESVFPGLVLTVGVEGAYTNVRRFVHEIETNRQFIIIDAVELESVRDSGGGANTPVSLNLDMAAYFRPDAAPTAPGEASANASGADAAVNARNISR